MKNITFNADCMEIMKQYSDQYFDLAIVDPPYGISANKMQMGDSKKGASVNNKIKNLRVNSGSGKLKNRILNTSNCDWDKYPPTAEYFTELFRVSKNQIIWGMNYFKLPPTRGFVCWNKNQPWENFSQCELAWTSFDVPAKLFTKSNRCGANTEKKIHPTQKPIELYDYLLHHFSKPGDKILDTHLGSGMSRLAAYKKNLYFVGVEIDLLFYQLQEKSDKNYSSQTILNL